MQSLDLNISRVFDRSGTSGRGADAVLPRRCCHVAKNRLISDAHVFDVRKTARPTQRWINCAEWFHQAGSS